MQQTEILQYLTALTGIQTCDLWANNKALDYCAPLDLWTNFTKCIYTALLMKQMTSDLWLLHVCMLLKNEKVKNDDKEKHG